VALRAPSLTLVQPLLVAGLLFALPLGAVLAQRRVTRTELATGGLVCAGLAVFLLAAHPGGGGAPPTTGRWIVVATAVMVVVAAVVLLTRGCRPAHRALALGTAAGLVNGLFAGLAKSVGTVLEHGVLAVVTSWQLWALVVVAGVTLTLAARAFQVGAPAAALTGLFAAEPLAGLTLGVALFCDTVRHSPPFTAVAAVGLLVALVGAVVLTYSPAVLAAYSDGSAPSRPAAARRVTQPRSTPRQEQARTLALTGRDRGP